MAFPIVASSNTTADTSSGSVTVAMPSGIQAGDLLMVFWAQDQNGTVTQSGGSDWTDIDQGAGSGSACRGGCFAKIAAGGDSLTLTSSSSQDFSCVAVRITGHGVSDVTTDITVGTASTGNDGVPDPPNCNPGSVKDYLWIETFACDDDDDTTNYESANYTKVAQIQSANSTSSCLCAVASRELNASAENPGVMATAANDEEWRAQTFAIPPALATTLSQDQIVTDADSGFDQAAVPGGASPAQDAAVAEADTALDQAVLAGGITIAQDAETTEADTAPDQGIIAAASPAQDAIVADADEAFDVTVQAGGVTIAQDATVADADTAFDGLVALTLSQDAIVLEADTALDQAVTSGGVSPTQDAPASDADTAFDTTIAAGGSTIAQDAVVPDSDAAFDAAIQAGGSTIAQDVIVQDADTAFDQAFGGEGDQTLPQDAPALESDTAFDAAVQAATTIAQDAIATDGDTALDQDLVPGGASPAQDAPVTDADQVFDASFPSGDEIALDHDEAFDAAISSGQPTEGAVAFGVTSAVYRTRTSQSYRTRVIP